MTPPNFTNANAVLAVLVRKMTSPVRPGFLTTGILAAILSSLDSQFLCIGSILTNDIVGRPLSRGRLTDRQRVLVGRFFVIGIVRVRCLGNDDVS